MRQRRSRSPVRKMAPTIPPYLADPTLKDLERTVEVFDRIENEDHITYSLPKPGATAGRVLAHAAAAFESLHRKHSPMTFKFGITHDAVFRWFHKPYGYQHTVERFNRMHIVYASSHPVGPAFLEAALIDKFGSYPVAIASCSTGA